MFKLIGGIFKILWAIVKTIGVAIGKFFELYAAAVRATCKFLGISVTTNLYLAAACEFAVCFVYMAVLTIIPELIIYNACKLTKKYRNLKTDEEKKEYLSKHVYFVLKILLNIKNKFSRKSAHNDAIIQETMTTRLSDEIIEDLQEEPVLGECKQNEETIENIELNDNKGIVDSIDADDKKADEPIDDIQIIEESKNTINTPNVNENPNIILLPEARSNIKLFYTSNIFGNTLRKGVVVRRNVLDDKQPFLVDFTTNPPKEVFTGSPCSDITLSKNVNGKKVEMVLDNPELLNNPKLYEELSREELETLKTTLMNDVNYQFALKSFFAMNQKALEHKKF